MEVVVPPGAPLRAGERSLRAGNGGRGVGPRKGHKVTTQQRRTPDHHRPLPAFASPPLPNTPHTYTATFSPAQATASARLRTARTATTSRLAPRRSCPRPTSLPTTRAAATAAATAPARATTPARGTPTAAAPCCREATSRSTSRPCPSTRTRSERSSPRAQPRRRPLVPAGLSRRPTPRAKGQTSRPWPPTSLRTTAASCSTLATATPPSECTTTLRATPARGPRPYTTVGRGLGVALPGPSLPAGRAEFGPARKEAGRLGAGLSASAARGDDQRPARLPPPPKRARGRRPPARSLGPQASRLS
jgi:hypothetical protein